MWYNVGTVSLVQGSVTVTGVGTDFVSNTRAADMFVGPDGVIYEVVNYTNETTLAIKPAYKGPSISNTPDYFVIPINGYTKLAADRLHKITLSIGNIEGDVAASAQNALEAKQARDAAEASEAAAKESEDNAKASELAAADSASSALNSKNAAANSQTVATQKAGESAASADAAQDSEDAAAASALAAHNSQVSAASSEAVAIDKATIASDKADIAITKANDTEVWAAEALDSKNAAAIYATSTNNDAIATAADRLQVSNDKAITLAARDEAVNAAATVTGSLIDKGYIDLSGGVYPAKPDFSAFWKVTVAGMVGGEDYGVGDTLVYTKPQDAFYKIDNTESVFSVAGYKGAVTKEQLGIDQINNTPDSAKPISTPQAAGLALKVAIADIVNNLTSTATDKPLSAAQGKTLYDLVQSNNTTIVRYVYTATAGQTTFSGADSNGKTLSYVPGVPIITTLNGHELMLTTDYTAASGSSLVLAEGAVLGDQLLITVFGAFSVANHYTIAESDGLYYQKSQVNTLISDAKDAVDQGFIEGLRLSWTSGTNIQISAGSAYVQSVAKRVRYAGGSITPMTVQALNTFVHIYLGQSGNILQSVTAPERYYNSAHRLTSDGSYRYLGSILVLSNAYGAAKFAHRLNDNFMQYMTGTSNSVDTAQRLVIAGTSAGATFTTTACVPITGHTLDATWQNVNTGTVQICPTDVVAPVSTSIVVYLAATSIVNSRCSIGADRSLAYSSTGGATLYAWCQGYWFDR